MKKSLYIFNDGEIRRRDNTIYFESDTDRKYIPIESIRDIFIFGEVSLNKSLLTYISQKQILLHFFNYYGYYTGTYYPREHLNSGYMILKQAEHYMDNKKRLLIARKIIEGSSKNMLNVIRYYRNRGRDLEHIEKTIEGLQDIIPNCENVAQLMAIEGNMRDMYYKSFDSILNNDDFIFVKRSRRPPKNELNAMMSFGNSLLYVQILSEIYKTHLDPRIGFLHTTNFRRFTLNLDIAEVFKPIIIDRIIFSLISKRMLTIDDFEPDMGGILLKDKGSKVFVRELDQRLSSTIKHRKLGRHVSYRRLIRMEAYKLQKHLLEEEAYEPYVSRW